MKKLTLIKIIALSFAGYIVVSGYMEGPASHAGWECTGAETDQSNPAGCNTGGGCHASSATAGIDVAIELDSAGIPTTTYIGGMSYTVKLTGTNNTNSSLPKFGFQIGSIVGATSQVTPTNVGTWDSPYPTNTHYAAPAKFYVVGVVEHGVSLPPTTGTGGNGTTYVEVLNWTAPPKGTGTISIWAALNAVDGNGTNDAGDLWNTNHIVINEPLPDGVNLLSGNKEVKVYPNPVLSHAVFTLGSEAKNGLFTLYDINGKQVKQSGFTGKQVILERENLESGIYFYHILDGSKTIAGKIIIQ